VTKKTDSTRYAVPALRFKTCRLLSGNVWNRELTIIQRRILRKLRNKKRSIKRKIYPRENLNSYIQSQTTRKLPLFHGDLPITEMHRGRERTSYIPFLLNPETRSDVIPVRLHFCETIPQARQPISHRRVCVNNGMVSITHFKVSRGDIISFQENDARARGEEIRRSFYIEISVEKRIGKFRDHPVRMWRRTKTEWFRLLKTKRGCRLLLKDRFLQHTDKIASYPYYYAVGVLLQRWLFKLLMVYLILNSLGMVIISLANLFPSIAIVPHISGLVAPPYMVPGTPEVDCTLRLGQPEVDCALRLGQPEVDCALHRVEQAPSFNFKELGGGEGPSSSEGAAVHGEVGRPPFHLELAPLIETKLRQYCLRRKTVELFPSSNLSNLDYKKLSLDFVERYKGKMISENQLDERRTLYSSLYSCDSVLFTFLKEKF